MSLSFLVPLVPHSSSQLHLCSLSCTFSNKTRCINVFAIGKSGSSRRDTNSKVLLVALEAEEPCLHQETARIPSDGHLSCEEDSRKQATKLFTISRPVFLPTEAVTMCFERVLRHSLDACRCDDCGDGSLRHADEIFSSRISAVQRPQTPTRTHIDPHRDCHHWPC
jgi:hypothetical protein